MLEFNSYASSSAGNLYSVTDGKTVLMLEAGLPVKKIRSVARELMRLADACLLTHEHMDHARSAALICAGHDLWATPGTADALNLRDHHRFMPVIPGEVFRIGTLNICAFPAMHDAAEPVGYIIHNPETDEKLLFAIDTAYIPSIEGLTHLAIEANYCASMIEGLDYLRQDRLYRTHFSIQAVCGWLASADRTQLKEIHLMHLSDGNSNEERFKSAVRAITGVPTYVCAK